MPKIPINFYYGSSEYLKTIPISEGNILYNITNKQILVDEDTNRQVYSNKTSVDTKLSTTSANPISNKVVSAEINALKTKQKTLETDLTKKGTASSNEVDDVRGQIHTNLLNPTLETTTINGITCTNNDDGTYTLNGTATESAFFNPVKAYFDSSVPSKMRLVGCPSSGSSTTYRMYLRKGNASPFTYYYDDGNGVEVIPTENAYFNITIAIVKGTTVENLVFKPMLTEDLSADYDSFVKYSGSEERLNEQVASLHDSSKGVITNLIEPTLGTMTINGVTCTANGDGTFTLNGTATNSTYFLLAPRDTVESFGLEHNKSYRISGCPKTGSNSTYLWEVYTYNSNNSLLKDNRDIGQGKTFSLSDNEARIEMGIRVYSGTTVNNATFKPMLTTDLDATYNDFVPYSGDGRLNENVAKLNSRVAKAENNITNINKTITNINNTVTAINKRDEVSGRPVQCGTCGGSPLYRFHGNYVLNSNLGANQTKDIPLSTFGVTLAKNQTCKVIRGSFMLEDENSNQVFLPDRRKATTGMSVVGIYNNNLRIMTYGTAYNAGCNIEIDIEYVIW